MSGRAGAAGLAVAAFLLFAWTCAIEPLQVASPSMLPTLEPGERIWLNKLAYRMREPARGDVVVVRAPDGASEAHYVKRLLGLPGERIDWVNEVWFVDGEPLPWRPAGSFEDALGERFDLLEVELAAGRFRVLDDPEVDTGNGSLLLQPGHYFVLGDHRDRSEDSRSFGAVRREALLGTLWGAKGRAAPAR